MTRLIALLAALFTILLAAPAASPEQIAAGTVVRVDPAGVIHLDDVLQAPAVSEIMKPPHVVTLSQGEYVRSAPQGDAVAAGIRMESRLAPRFEQIQEQ
jgi:hypothetical protein